MKIRILYLCEGCRTEYSNKEDAINCERTHEQSLTISNKKYLGYKNDHNMFPVKIQVANDDGRTCWYRRVKDSDSLLTFEEDNHE